MKPRISEEELKAFTLLLLLILIFYPYLSEPRFDYLSNISKSNPQGFASYLTTYEVDASMFLLTNLDQNTLVVSDPYTMFFLKAISGAKVGMNEMVWIEDNEYSLGSLLQLENLKKVFSGTYLDTSVRDPNATVIFDDDETFWSVYAQGNGGLGLDLSEQDSEKVSGVSSLEIAVGSGNYTEVGLSHTFDVLQDWSTMCAFDFWWSGANSGDTFEIRIFTTSDGAFTYRFEEYFSGWQRFIIPFEDFNCYDGTWDGVKSIYFVSINSNGTRYLDNVVLHDVNWDYFSETQRVFHDVLIDMFSGYEKIVVVYSKRTSTWAKSTQNFIRNVSNMTDMQFAEGLSNSKYFTVAFSLKNDIYIFTLN